jgi:hypothetical protein
MWLREGSRVVSFSRASTAALGLAVFWSCVATPREPPPQLASSEHKPFGGERAGFGEALGTRVVDENVGRCQDVPALDQDPLLADFEQDSIFLRPVPGRHGSWYTANDGSPGGKQVPESYAAVRGGHGGSNYAVRYQVEGFGDWGGVLGFQLRYVPEAGIKCPFNAQAFEGISFMARGSGRIRVGLSIPETTPSDQEGRCQRSCWDSHGAYVFLTEEWKEQRLAWADFAQQGWGTPARLSLKELLAVNFAIGRQDQPAELWLDDVRFIQRSTK